MTKIEVLVGIHSVQAVIKTAPQRVKNLYVFRERNDQRMQNLLALAKTQQVSVSYVERNKLDELSTAKHQGVIAEVLPSVQLDEKSLYDYLKKLDQTPLVLVLDGVTDPHNLGACMRSADAAGVHVVIIPKDNSASLTEVARKVASGAAEVIPLVAVTNLARCLKKLQEQGLWLSGAAGEAEHSIYEADLSGPRVIVMGAEGSGMRRLTRETCDELVKIPMRGSVSSLNVSVACGVILFEALRQRSPQ